MVERRAILRSYLTTHLRRRASRAAIERRQYAALLAHPRLEPLMRGALSLDEALGRLPVQSAAAWRECFATLNRFGITLDGAREFARAELAGRPAFSFPGISFGLSTGTTGAPGVFLSTSAERAIFLGTILAKCLPPTKLFGCRIALLLKHNNSLYADVVATRFLRFAYFDIAEPVERWSESFCAFAPDVVVGPPSALLAVAASRDFARRPVRPHTLMAGAEPLFPSEAKLLSDAYGTEPRPIYQASEGFLAVGCQDGLLHVNEDVLIAEWRLFGMAPGRAVPVITDFTRNSQDVWRLQLDDVVRLQGEGLAAGKCGCGAQYRPLLAVEGRMADVLYGCNNDDRFAQFPFDLEALMGPLLDCSGKWQIIQSASDELRVATEHPLSGEQWQKVRDCLFHSGGWPRTSHERLAPRPLSVKRRRFVRQIDPSSSRLMAALQPPARA